MYVCRCILLSTQKDHEQKMKVMKICVNLFLLDYRLAIYTRVFYSKSMHSYIHKCNNMDYFNTDKRNNGHQSRKVKWVSCSFVKKKKKNTTSAMHVSYFYYINLRESIKTRDINSIKSVFKKIQFSQSSLPSYYENFNRYSTNNLNEKSISINWNWKVDSSIDLNIARIKSHLLVHFSWTALPYRN